MVLTMLTAMATAVTGMAATGTAMATAAPASRPPGTAVTRTVVVAVRALS